MEFHFHRKSEGRMYIKAQTKTALYDVLKKVSAYEWERIGVKYTDVLNLNSNEFMHKDISSSWNYMRDIMKKVTTNTKEILVIADYVYYDEQYYGDCVNVYFFCGGKTFSHKFHSDQNEFNVFSRTDINNPKEWIDFIDFELSRESTIILANFGITDLKRGVKPIKFLEIKDEFRGFIIMLLPAVLNLIGIQQWNVFGVVMVFLAMYLTFRLKDKMKVKIMFVLNLIISILSSLIAILAILGKVIEWALLSF